MPEDPNKLKAPPGRCTCAAGTEGSAASPASYSSKKKKKSFCNPSHQINHPAGRRHQKHMLIYSDKHSWVLFSAARHSRATRRADGSTENSLLLSIHTTGQLQILSCSICCSLWKEKAEAQSIGNIQSKPVSFFPNFLGQLSTSKTNRVKRGMMWWGHVFPSTPEELCPCWMPAPGQGQGQSSPCLLYTLRSMAPSPPSAYPAGHLRAFRQELRQKKIKIHTRHTVFPLITLLISWLEPARIFRPFQRTTVCLFGALQRRAHVQDLALEVPSCMPQTF